MTRDREPARKVPQDGAVVLDGTALLIPLIEFLPLEDSRMPATVERVDKVLKQNGLVHRFVPEKTSGRPDQPMGNHEGAFLKCMMRLAEVWQMLGEHEKFERALGPAEAHRGTPRLCSEAVNAPILRAARKHAASVHRRRLRLRSARHRDRDRVIRTRAVAAAMRKLDRPQCRCGGIGD